MTTLNFVEKFIGNSKEKIIELAKTELENKEKKQQLDEFIKKFVEDAVKNMKLGWLTNLVIKKWLIPNISALTQYVYDLLKAKL